MSSSLSQCHAVRDFDTDCMRIISAFFVVLIHCSGVSSITHMAYNGLSRFSVPVFVLISGYYLLPRDIALDRLARKVFTLFLTALVWSALYLLNQIFVYRQVFDAKEIARFILTLPVHLWYLYALIGLYLFTPLLAVFHQHADKQQYQYILLLLFLLGSPLVLLLRSGSFPVLEEIISRMKIPYTTGFLFLFLSSGYFAKFGISSRCRRFFPIIGIAGTMCTIIVTIFLHGSETPLSFFSPNVMVSGIGFFVFCKDRFQSVPQPVRQFIQQLAPCMSGVYLVHMMLLSWISFLFDRLPVLIQPLLQAVVVFILSTCLVFVLRKTPVLKRIFL